MSKEIRPGLVEGRELIQTAVVVPVAIVGTGFAALLSGMSGEQALYLMGCTFFGMGGAINMALDETRANIARRYGGTVNEDAIRASRRASVFCLTGSLASAGALAVTRDMAISTGVGIAVSSALTLLSVGRRV